MAKVYVSSTIADLEQERRAVLDWLRLARHQAVDSYLPDSDTVRQSCLDDVAACDLYVLILGHRYGFVPADDNPGGLSITQLEFRRAGECGIPRVALLRTSIPDVRVSDLEDPARAPLVLAFRAEMARQVRAAEFSDLQGLIQGLSTGIQGELDKLDKQDKQAAGPVTASLALRLAPRPLFLAGREELLAELETRLTGDDDARPRVAALCGLGGAGKTSVAIEYAHRHLAEVGVCWQFPAEDPAVLAAEFAVLAAQLGARAVVDPRDPVASVHAVLAQAEAGWLVVFDNAPDRASVEPFVPPAGPGRVLITTQNQHWPPGQALDVPVLDPEVAAGFLVNRTGDPGRATARELAAELGGLPLALEQAAAYIQASGDSLAGYLASFLQRRKDLLARGEPTGYRERVATAWALAFAQLEQSAPGAVGLLRLLASCAPEAIPLHLLLQPRPGLADTFGPEVAPVLVPLLEDELAAKDAIVDLRRYSLISPPADGSVSVHRLVQAVTGDEMSADLASQWHQAAATLIEAAIPSDTDRPTTWPACTELLPHAQVALADDSDGMTRIANFLAHSGSYAAARDLWHRVFDARERVVGPENSRTLQARQELAYLTGEAGDAAGARDQFTELLPDNVRVLGPEDPETLKARASVAGWTGQAGDPAGAREKFTELLPDAERVFSPDHPETLRARASLARWTGEAGNAAEARDQFTELLPDDVRVLGPDHPDTLTARFNLGHWTGHAGDPAGARDQFTELLPDVERVRSPEHPDTLRARSSVARWTGEAGDAAGARDQFTELLPDVERMLGLDHPDTLMVRATLGHWTGRPGDPAGAREKFTELLPDLVRVLRPEHPETLKARASIARWTGEAGDAAGARDQLTELLPDVERMLGPKHAVLREARASLARWTGEAGNAAGARDQLTELLPDLVRVLRPEHPETLRARANIARWTGEAGNAAGARDQLTELLPDVERVLGPEHPDTMTIRGDLAYWTEKVGDSTPARRRGAT